MTTDLAISTPAQPSAASSQSTAAESQPASEDFVAVLAEALSAEAATAAPAPIAVPAPVLNDKADDSDDLLDASAMFVNPQALILTLEQAQRTDLTSQPASTEVAKSSSVQSDRAVIATVAQAANDAAVAAVVATKSDAILETLDQIESDSRSESANDKKFATEMSLPALAANVTAHERISELGERPVIRAHVGTGTWTEELAGKLTVMVGKNISSASLQLSPEHLGPLEIRISVQNEQASVWFGAAHAETRAALEQSLPRLRELLAGQGLNLSDAGVFREAPRQQQKQFSHSPMSVREGEREFVVAVGRRGIVDAYA